MDSPSQPNPSQPNPSQINSTQPGLQTSHQLDPNEQPPQNPNTNTEEQNDDKLTLGKRKGKTSAVWDHFRLKKINGKMKALCIQCDRELGGESRNGTKHLHDHLKRCPKRKQMDLRQQILTAKNKKDDGTVSIKGYYFNQETSRKEMASMIIMHDYPINIVNHYGFRRYSLSLQPMYRIVSPPTVRSDILKIFEFEKKKLMKVLENNSSRIGITSDMWTSSNKKKGYLVVTGHYIDDSWRLQSRILRFAYVPCPHTAEALCEVIMECLLDWNIDRKLSTITLDNCSTNNSLIDHVMCEIPSSTLMLKGKLFHMPCCAHILNIIVKDGLKEIDEAIERIRDSVAYWTATQKREEKFEEAARQLDISLGKKLELDCITRWNSTYKMLETAITYKDVFPRLRQREPHYKCLPNDDDWKIGKEICGKLKVFYNVTELFSGTKYPTANLYFPQVCLIKMQITEWFGSGNEVIRRMASKMWPKFEKYWDMIHGLMGVATVLDPRYKMQLLEYYFPLLYGSEASKELEMVKQICYDLLSEYQTKTSEQEAGSNMGTTMSSFSHGVDSLDAALSGFDLFVKRNQHSNNRTVKSELDYYLEEDVLPRTENFEILNWWKSSGLKYPTLQLIAIDVLAIPVSTVASESTFSTSGRILSAHRSRLQPEILEALMCARNWLWANMPGDFSASNDESVCEPGDDMIEVIED